MTASLASKVAEGDWQLKGIVFLTPLGSKKLWRLLLPFWPADGGAEESGSTWEQEVYDLQETELNSFWEGKCKELRIENWIPFPALPNTICVLHCDYKSDYILIFTLF